MSNQPSKEEIAARAAQFRKPEGDEGLELGEFMNLGNKGMTLFSIAALEPQANDNILEIGMGNGYYTKNIVNLDSSIQYTGYDYSKTMVDAAISINQDLINRGQVKFIEGDIRDMPFEDDAFDKIFTVNTFYFWDDHEKAISELRRVLKPGGRLLIVVRPKSNTVNFPVTEYGFSLWENEAIVELCNKHGFSKVEMTHIKEPDLTKGDSTFPREAVIFDCMG